VLQVADDIIEKSKQYADRDKFVEEYVENMQPGLFDDIIDLK